MSIPLIDLHLKYIVDHSLRVVKEDPDKYLKDIFGDAKLEPHVALFGDHLINQVKDWITTVNIPVVLGFDLDPTQFPGVSINLEGSSPDRMFIGDAGETFSVPLLPYEREIVVPKFSPKEVTMSADRTYITVTLPDDMPPEEKQKVFPGLRIRDKSQNEYGIGQDDFKITAVQLPGKASLDSADLSSIEIISPYEDSKYREGAMVYDESALITIHGHAARPEGLWLWAIVHWGLLKFRPVLTAVFGMDISVPRASDFAKDDSFLGTNVWRRFITLSAKSVWSWEAAKQQDILGFLMTIRGTSSDPTFPGPDVLIL